MEILNKPDPIKKKSKAKAAGETASAETPVPGNGYIENLLFWDEFERVDKDNGKKYIEYKFNYGKFPFFLSNNGFKKINVGATGYQYARLVDNKLEAVEPREIHAFILEYLQKQMKPAEDGIYTKDSLAADPLSGVHSMYVRGSKNYSNPSVYLSVPSYIPKFKRDTRTNTFLYFQNGVVEISAAGCQFKPYKNFDGNIWTKHISPFDFTLADDLEAAAKKSVAYQFMALALAGGSTNDDGKDDARLKSLLTTIGYVVDTHKDLILSKAVIFADKEPNLSGSDSHGGSGKSLVAKMIMKIVNTCLIDGKEFGFDKPWAFDDLRIDHKLIVFNDIVKKFPFDRLFHKLTEGWKFSKKYIDSITIPYEDSPKVIVITNYSLQGEGSSYRRRQQYIEFSNYFDDQHTPAKEFGHTFFADWGNEQYPDEWNLFYNFFCYCVMLFKKEGLLPFPEQNQRYNKLLAAAGQEFIDYMDDQILGDQKKKDNGELYWDSSAAMHPGVDTPEGTRVEKDLLFKGLKETFPNSYGWLTSTNKMTGWIELWAGMRGIQHRKDKSDKKYVWVFTRKNEKA